VKVDPANYTGSVRPLPYVREDDCVGCNLCSLVCPVDDCITMVERPPLRESVTWGEISAAHPDVTLRWDKMQQYREEKGIDIH